MGMNFVVIKQLCIELQSANETIPDKLHGEVKIARWYIDHNTRDPP